MVRKASAVAHPWQEIAPDVSPELPATRADEAPARPFSAPPSREVPDRETFEREYQRGYADGRRAAAEAAELVRRQTRQQVIEEYDQLTLSIGAAMAGFQERLEQDLFRFALAVAERIVRREVMMDNATVIRQVKDAIRRVVGVESIRLRVHPRDEEMIRQHRPAIIASVDSLRDLVVEPDDTMEPGGCIIDSSSGNVDARISTQIQQIETALFGVRPSTQEVS